MVCLVMVKMENQTSKQTKAVNGSHTLRIKPKVFGAVWLLSASQPPLHGPGRLCPPAALHDGQIPVRTLVACQYSLQHQHAQSLSQGTPSSLSLVGGFSLSCRKTLF